MMIRAYHLSVLAHAHFVPSVETFPGLGSEPTVGYAAARVGQLAELCSADGPEAVPAAYSPVGALVATDSRRVT